MIFQDLRDTDFSDLGSATTPVKYILLTFVLVLIVIAGYFLLIKDKRTELEQTRQQELVLLADFEFKQQKAANLEAYEQQLEEMRESFGAMLRQLPNQTEVADLLVDVSQTGLASGLEFELFQPRSEVPREFYAELPISIRVIGGYHEFGEFISGVAALPRIVTIHDVKITKVGNAGDLGMNLTAKTYRYLEEDNGTESGGDS